MNIIREIKDTLIEMVLILSVSLILSIAIAKVVVLMTHNATIKGNNFTKANLLVLKTDHKILTMSGNISTEIDVN